VYALYGMILWRAANVWRGDVWMETLPIHPTPTSIHKLRFRSIGYDANLPKAVIGLEKNEPF
jgi:hypothetical protein